MNFRKSLLAAIFGFFIGVFINSFFNLDFWFSLLPALFGAVFLFLQRLQKYERGKNLIFSTLAFLFIGISVGVLRYQTSEPKNLILENRINQKTTFEMIITDEPQEKENYTKIIAKTAEEKVLIYARHYPKFNYGDKIEITGELKKPQKFFAQSLDREITDKFDWPAHLAKDKIYYQMFYPQISFISARHGSFVKEKLFAVKSRFIENLEKIIPSPASSFMAGVTIGAKNELPKTLKDDLIKTGTIHLVVLSGYNITIVAKNIINFLKIFPLPRFLGGIFGAFGVILFTIMTGAEAATVRAAIMALLIIAAHESGRIYAAIYALIFAAFFMVLANPMILLFDSSFQLSFLATLGLIYFTPKFDKLFYFVPKAAQIKENLTATLGAQTAVLPLLIYKTGIISFVSIPLNIIILTFMPITMFLGFLTGALGFLNYYLSYPFGIISHIFLGLELYLIKIFAAFTFSYITF